MAKNKERILDPVEALGESIKKISDAIVDLKKTGINRKCVIDLMYLQTKLSRKVITTVFDSLEDLKKVYCGPE